MVGSAASRTLDRVGREVQLRNRVEVDRDDYGPEYDDTADSPHPLQARVDVDSDAGVVRDAGGSEVRVEADIFIDASTTAVANVTEGGHGGATRVEVDGTTYVVVVKDDQDNGLLRLLCGRKD